MEQLEAAILRTVLYADVFNFALTIAEIHHFLIHDEPVTHAAVEQTLDHSTALSALLHCENGFITAAGRGHLIAVRTAREQASATLWPLALQYGRWLARLPFVRMVALTGALAMRNAADSHDDLDYLIVTASHRVWLARAFAIVLVRLARRQGVQICPNYVLAENSLMQERQDIFIAHEVAQMVPLYGTELYRRFRAVNDWVLTQLPNTDHAFYNEPTADIGRGWMVLKRLGELALLGPAGNWLESWEHRRKLRRFAAQRRSSGAFVRLDSQQVKGHFDDHGSFVLQQYHERLRRCGLETMPMPSGD